MLSFDWPWKPDPDYTQLRDAIYRGGDPNNIRFLELFADDEVIYKLLGISPAPEFQATQDWMNWYLKQKTRFWYELGYDAFWQDIFIDFPQTRLASDDTAELKRQKRLWVDEKTGMINSWQDFETYPWPKPEEANYYPLDYLAKTLPEGMAIIARVGGVLEQVMWLVGYEAFALLIYDDPTLIDALFKRVEEIFIPVAENIAQRERVMALWMGDDMGYKTATMIAPKHLRKYVFPIQKKIADIAHKNGIPFMLHSCGQLESVMDDLISFVGIDSKHSFEDVITPVENFVSCYGDRISVIGGVDVDLLCRGSEDAIRSRTRHILEACAPSRGYILGTGNTVANYIPIKNYLTMLDEGQRFNHGL
jgi:uroporphyrinogen decarboxylase